MAKKNKPAVPFAKDAMLYFDPYHPDYNCRAVAEIRAQIGEGPFTWESWGPGALGEMILVSGGRILYAHRFTDNLFVSHAKAALKHDV